MHYFVDGYNLLFRIIHGDQALLTKRQQVIADLNEKIQILNLDVTIVFDGMYQLGDTTRSHFNHLEIIFTSNGESADDFIISAIKRIAKPQDQTVVTSDRRLAWHIRRYGAKTESINEFLEWLNKRYRNRKQQIETQDLASKTPLNKAKHPVKIPLPTTPPEIKASIEGCFDYYLESFQKNFDELLIQKPSRKKKLEKPTKINKTSKKKNRPKEAVRDPHLTDYERWLKAFNKDADAADS